MNRWTVETILERRAELRLSWGEPWAATSPDGVETYADVVMTASVDDCIAIARFAHMKREKPLPMENLTDEVLLGDFMAVHWATVVPSKHNQ